MPEETKPTQTEKNNRKPAQETDKVSSETTEKPTKEIAQPSTPEIKIEELKETPASTSASVATSAKEAKVPASKPTVEPAPTPETVEEPIIEKSEVETPEPSEPITPKEQPALDIAEEIKTKEIPVSTPTPPPTTKPTKVAPPAKTIEPPVVSKVEPSFKVKYFNKLKEQLGLANQKRTQIAQKNLDKIMQYAREKQKITNDDVEKLTGVGHRQASRYLKQLTKNGLLMKFGKNINTFYKPIQK